MIEINAERCIGCGACIDDCFAGVMKIVDGVAVPVKKNCNCCGHCIAVCPENAIKLLDHDMSEVIELADMDYKISPQTYLNHIKARRSIRHFTDRKVTDQELDMIIETGRFSPTGSNLQNVSYFICQDDIVNFRDMIMEELKLIGEEELVSAGPNSRYARFWLNMYEDYKTNGTDKLFFNAGTVIVVASGFPQAGLIAASHMESMVYCLDLGMVYSGFTMRAISHSEKLKEYIGLKEDYQVYTALVIGEPDIEFRRTVPRRKADVIRK